MQKEKFTAEAIVEKLNDWPDLLGQLAAIRLFEGIPQEEIHEILKMGNIVFLESNEFLIKQNDLENELYILLQGHLVITKAQDHKEFTIAEISPIDIVGEMSFFTTNPRNANVIPIRDSILIELPRDQILKNPNFIKFITNIAKITTERLVSNRSIQSIYKRKIKTITLIPAGDFQNIDIFAKKLYKAIQIYGTVFLQNKTETNQSFLYEKEDKYDYVISILDREVSQSAMLCINHTDHLIFVGEESNGDDLSPLEQFILKEKKYLHRKEFVLLKAAQSENKDIMYKFINSRQIDSYYNILNENENEDYERLARCIIGKNTCLVLSGGGARGLAHVGTIRALLEKKISIDVIGGTSMGSLVAAAYARYGDYGKFYEAIEKFCYNYKFNKYTLPFVSVFTGQDFTRGFKVVCGEDTHIENLKRRFFCVASNLSILELKIFKIGLLWNAVRASFSIPAVLPPIINEKGEILVDGCIMDNLPVDHMRAMSNGGRVIASQIIQTGSIHRYDPSDGIVRGSRLLLNKLNPFGKKINMPHINFLFMKSMLVSSQAYQLKMANEADSCVSHDIKRVGLFEFKSLEKTVEIGYQNAMEQLADL